MIVYGAPEFNDFVIRGALVARARWFSLMLTVVSLIGWGHFGAPWSATRSIYALISADKVCPLLTTVAIEQDKAKYYKCLTNAIWRTSPSPYLKAFSGGGTVAMAARVLAAACCCLLLVSARLTARESKKVGGVFKLSSL